MEKAPSRDECIRDLTECARLLLGKDHPTSEEIMDVYALSVFVTDPKGRYLHWQDLRNRIHNRNKALAHWTLLKNARKNLAISSPELNHVLGRASSWIVTTPIQQAASMLDLQCTSAALNELMRNYAMSETFLQDFTDEESIASSQMEGASTTRVVAKKMLAEGRRPRNESEKMIMGNRNLMELAWESRFDEFSVDLLLSFHRAACIGINDDKYLPGQIRTTNDIWIAGRDDEIVHRPPEAAAVPEMLKALAAWANTPHRGGQQGGQYIHPVVKSSVLHFCMGYIHPFMDGNGRVARALCYWFLFSRGYEVFRYVSISSLLRQASVRYGEAYLKTETDDMDLTYFIEYQCSIYERAVSGLLNHVRDSARKLREFETWLFESGLGAKIPPTQLMLIKSALCLPGQIQTIRSLSERAGISASAARNHLEALAEAGILMRSGGGGNRAVQYQSVKSPEKLRREIATLIKNQ